MIGAGGSTCGLACGLNCGQQEPGEDGDDPDDDQSFDQGETATTAGGTRDRGQSEMRDVMHL
jgi:hypothetical protein